MTIVRKSNLRRKIEIDITGPDGNAYALLGNARSLAKQLDWSKEESDALLDRMRSGDYENLVEEFDKAFGEYVDILR